MKRYIRLYTQFLRLNLSLLILNRTTLVNNTVSSILWGVFPLITMYLLTARVKSVYGWDREELYALTGYFIFVHSTFMMLFGKSFKRFSVLLDKHSLDAILLKPVDSQFLISFWYVNFTALTRTLFGLSFFLYMLHRLEISFSFGLLVELIAFSFLGLTVEYCLWFGVLTIAIWFAKALDIREFLLALNSVTRFPPEVYYNLPLVLAVLFLPLSFIIGYPTRILLGKADITDIIALFTTAVVIFLGSRLFWKFALRYYTSASG